MTGAHDVPDFVLDWARSPGPDRVLSEARSRLERHRLGPQGTLRVDLAPDERRRVGMMLDAAWASATTAVPVRRLRSGLKENGCTLEDLLVAIGGPLRDRPAEQEKADRLGAQERADALAELRSLLGPELPQPARDLVDAALDRWVLRRYPAGERAREVARVVTALPGPADPVLLAVLAAQVARDAHALDRSRPLGRAVARFLAVRAQFAEASAAEAFADDSFAGTPPADRVTGWTDPAGSAEGWRTAWALGGVACDTVSSQVLVLNLPLAGDAAAVRLSRAAGSEPLWLSLRALSGDLSLERPTDVFVCENPSILETAADRLGERCAPLVCTFGRPGLAAIQLLRAVAGSARLRIRADGDAAGWGIVATLTAALPAATPWRMPPETTAFEEELLELLLADLSGGGQGD